MAAAKTSLEKGLAMLYELAEAEAGMTIGSLASALDLNRTTAYRLCEVLTRSGWVQPRGQSLKGGPNRFDLGPRALGLGVLTTSKYDPDARIQNIVEELAEQIEETVHAATLDRVEVIHIARAVPDSGPHLAVRLGAREFAHVTALGKAMLATFTRDKLLRLYREEQLVERTPKSIRTRTALLSELERIRAQKFAVDDEESRPGVYCVAAPVFGRGDEAHYAISVTSLPIHFEGERLQVVINAVKEAATRATCALGGSPPAQWKEAEVIGNAVEAEGRSDSSSARTVR
jgi:DNA-binding IclR family transcriptional regulator